MKKNKSYYSNFDIEDANGDMNSYSVSMNEINSRRVKINSSFNILKKPLFFSWHSKKIIGSCITGEVRQFYHECS